MTPLMPHTPIDLPRFSEIKPATIQARVEAAIEHCKHVITRALAQPKRDWQHIITPIDEADDALSQLWSPVSHMNSVVSSDELREAHDACLPLLSEYGTWVGQHEGLYQAYCAIRDDAAFTELSEAQQKVIQDGIRDFT